jgi:Protein of unknown function (DUF3990)
MFRTASLLPPVGGFPAPPGWVTSATHLHLFHGCLRRHARAITASGVDPTIGNPDTDFGRGFYTTTDREQAEQWAHRVYARNYFPAGNPADPPVVLEFRVALDELAGLEWLGFARGDPDHEPFWSFVRHCRSSRRGTPFAGAVIHTHLRPGTTLADEWYDVVSGPVVGWNPPPGGGRPIANDRWVIGSVVPGPHSPYWFGYDQFSFHTDAGAGVLNAVIKKGAPEFVSHTLTPLF